jgi:hypothetical protein
VNVLDAIIRRNGTTGTRSKVPPTAGTVDTQADQGSGIRFKATLLPSGLIDVESSEQAAWHFKAILDEDSNFCGVTIQMATRVRWMGLPVAIWRVEEFHLLLPDSTTSGVSLAVGRARYTLGTPEGS